MNHGLPDQTINQILKTLAGFPQVEQAILYGSRAKGNFKPGSDIDLALSGDVNLETLFRINHALDELSLPYFFDVTILKELNSPELRDHIARRGIVIYPNSKPT